MVEIKIVSEQSALEIARHRAAEDAAAEIRHLTANLLRMTAGAGRPEDLFREILTCADRVEACVKLRMSAADLPLDLAYDGLRLFRAGSSEDHKRWAADGTAAGAHANHTIIIEALRVVAGGMLGQTSQANRAGSKLYRAISDSYEAQEKQRKYLRMEKR
ncbi:MAG TPA: hypothetical protein VKR31_07185 [Rhizomicrobium sp.]|nr:hypothetical protein [Rhizomicrobium sp.]